MHTIIKWFRDLFSDGNRQWIDSYLEKSVDIHDLEFRIKMLARRGIL